MNAPLAWDVDGSPVPQGSLRAHMAGGHPVLVYTNREPLALWRDSIRDACPILEPSSGAFSVHMQFRVKRPAGHYAKAGIAARFEDATPCTRPDLDKLVRAVLDALTMRVWRDDGQVVEVKASKRYSECPGVTIMVDRL
jgi:Holliday junction resolvase RusA-like endonuclease